MREALIDRMIAIYGFEHFFTVEFARLCERQLDNPQWDELLLDLVEKHEENPVFED